MAVADNFINMEKVLPFEESLEQSIEDFLDLEIKHDSPKQYTVKLVEHRNTLSDSRASSFGFLN